MDKSINLYFLCAILSIILYFIAPYHLDYLLQVICALLFLLQAIKVVRDDIRSIGVLNFNLLFCFSFFFVTYAFPLFLMVNVIRQKEGIEAYIDFDVAGKCTALCTFAISIYFWSYKKCRNKIMDFSLLVKSDYLKYINIIYPVVFAILAYITVVYMRSDGGIAVDSGSWEPMFLACLPLCLIYNCRRKKVNNLSSFISKNIFALITTFILIFLYFIIGDRGIVIIGGIMIVSVYSILVKRIRPFIFLIGIVLGSVLMYAIRETRTLETSLSSGDTKTFVETTESTLSEGNVLSVFADLTGIHRELYIGYDYVKHKGFLLPSQIIIVPFYPIPLIPNIMSEYMYGKTMMEIRPSHVLNEYMRYTRYGNFGIHCVIDIYMRWGVLGVLLCFYMWGYVVSSITKTKYKSDLGIALYVVLLAYAIYTPRGSILDMFRILSLVMILVWIANSSSKRLKLKR